MKEFTRTCPCCNKDIKHKSQRSYRQCKKENRVCQSCAAKKRIEKYGCGEQFEKYTIKGAFAGKQNPFYGKTHTEETKEKIKNRDKSYFQDPKYLAKLSQAFSGDKNPMYGKSYYQIWVEKYGKEEADRRQEIKNQKSSKQCSGEGNPMFGKPAPQGSGNGWSGWYNGWYFRSLKELSYVVNVLNVNNDSWQSAETLGIKIPYINWNGQTRNYIPDFLVNSSLLVEVKPSRLKSSVSVRLKEEAAKKFVTNRGWQYVIVDPPSLKDHQITSLHENGSLKFIDRYEKLYEARWLIKKGLT